MPVVAHLIIRDYSPEQYDRTRAEVGWLENPPVGGYSHVTWWEGNDCHIIDAWEDEAAFSAFGSDRLGPALAKLGIEAEQEVTFHTAHEVYTPRSVKLV